MKFTSDILWNWWGCKVAFPNLISYLPISVSHWLKISWFKARSSLKVHRHCACGERLIEQNCQGGKQGLRNKGREREYLHINSTKWTRGFHTETQKSYVACSRFHLSLCWTFVAPGCWYCGVWGPFFYVKTLFCNLLFSFHWNYNGRFNGWGL